MERFKDFSDNNLIKAFQKGDSAAFDVLIDRHQEKIYSSIFFMVRETWIAEDIYQDTFMRVIDTLRNKNYNEEGKFLPWAIRISHNLCIDYFRKQKRKLPVVVSDNDDIRDIFENIDCGQENVEQRIMREESYAKMFELLDLLPPDQREVIVLRHFADLSFKEIASMTHCSINTALGRMRYALINLRRMVEEHKVVL